MNPWESLEALPGLIAVPAVWQRRMGSDFPALNAICLEPDNWLVGSYPCPRKCGCWHKVIPPLPSDGRGIKGEGPSTPDPRHSPHPRLATAVCQCTPPACPDLTLTIADITPLKLNWKKLARELCRALMLTSKFAPLSPPNTVQIGTWSAAAVPAILTIHVEAYRLRSAVAELVALLDTPFILFVPTSDQIDARPQTLLHKRGAAFFPLDSTVTIAPNGSLHPVRPPGELFARFTPQPKEPVPEETARQLFALAKALDTETGIRKALPSTVLRLYCVDALEPTQIARKLACARSLIFARLDLLTKKLGRHPAQLRQYSSHLQAIEDSLSDPRARHIRRKAAATGDQDSTED